MPGCSSRARASSMNDLQRLLRGVVDHDVDDQRRLGQGHARAYLAAQRADQQPRRPPAALALIDVRVGAIGDRRRAVVDQPRRQVAVQVERDDDGQVRPQRAAQPGQHLAVGVEVRLGDHRPVQGQQQAVGPLARTPSMSAAGDLVEDVVGDGAGRRRPGHEQRHRLEAFRGRRFEEAADLVMGVAPLVEQGGPKVRPWAAKAARSVRRGLKVFDSCMKPAMAMRT